MQRIAILLSVVFLGASSMGASAAKDEQPLDDNFLIKASSCTHAAINISKLADKHAASPKVKEFAAMAVKEHQQLFDKLAEIIKNRKIGVVAGLEKDTKADMDRLSKLEGSDFDREYLKWIIQTHKKAIPMVEAQIENGKDADSVAFAKEALPKIKEHLKHAEALAKNLGS